MNLEQIKNEYAVSKGYNDWYDLYASCVFIINEFEKHTDNVCELAQKECLKRVSENAEVKHDFNLLNKPNTFICEKKLIGLGVDFYEVNKESITNENNIIK